MIVYTKDNCPACMTLKNKLHMQNIEFKEINIGRDITIEEFKLQYPNVRVVPFTITSEEDL